MSVLNPGQEFAASDNAESNKNTNYSDEIPSIISLYIKMMHVFKEILFMLLLFVAYAAITHNPPKISKTPPAFPFFKDNSIIKDWYRGEISAAINHAMDSDIGFVMFYAPWDAESQEVRVEFEKTAEFMHKFISFSAVNCWQPGSECRIKYNKVYSWPVLIAYTTHGRVVQYNGPRTAPHMIKFLSNVMDPFVRIESIDEGYKILAKHDALILARIDTRPASLEFATFYNTALKFLEKDPFREIAFAILSKSPHDYSFLQLHMWNETLLYPSDLEMKTGAIVSWILKHLHQITMWVAPVGAKSQQLSRHLQGPSLILFTPQNPLLQSIDYYNMLKQISLDYFNCDNNINMEAIAVLMNMYRSSSEQTFLNLLQDCTKSDFKKVVTYSPSLLWSNNTSCLNEKIACKNENCDLPKPKFCDDCIEIFDDRKEFFQYGDLLHFKTSMETGKNDPKSPKNLLKLWQKNRCNLINYAQKFEPALFSELDLHNGLNIKGLSCESNNTLNIIALDSLKYHHFAESFGLDVLKQKNKTALLIIDDKLETHYIYKARLTDRTIKEFLINFTRNNLQRALYDSSAKYRHTHVYAKNKDCDVCVTEMDSHTFLPTILDDNNVIVLYHSKQCSFCGGISHLFLTVAKILSFVSSIKFARINGDLNTLPWEYTMETYPSILFFPAKRKSESRVFPQDLPITVPNLVGFILNNLDASMKLNVMWSICNQALYEEDKNNCIAALRSENLAVIEETLKEWRSVNLLQRRKILYDLRHLKSLHLQLALSPYNETNIKKCLQRMQKHGQNLNFIL